MAGDKVTSLEVARLAGVSQSAVSRVFTPGASASAETKRKVHKAAAMLGYRPNVLARAMVSGKSRIIGLLVGYLENHFYPAALEQLSAALQARGYHVLIFMGGPSEGNMDEIAEEILGYQVDGLVTASVSMSSALVERCRNAGVPMVLFNRAQPGEAFAAITSDNRAGGALAARFLLAGGHRRIGYIAGWEDALTQRDREAGFVEGLARAGMTLAAREVGNFDIDEARAAARRMFAGQQEPDRPDAVFVCNDHMAFGVMDVLRHELGLRVPQDVSVVGFDDVAVAGWPAYDLTTLRQQSQKMVDATVEMLLDLIEGRQEKPAAVRIEAPLIVRGSARIPPGWTRSGD